MNVASFFALFLCIGSKGAFLVPRSGSSVLHRPAKKDDQDVKVGVPIDVSARGPSGQSTWGGGKAQQNSEFRGAILLGLVLFANV
jgi:hypothetical protein